MEEFGIRFSSTSSSNFGALKQVFLAIKADKDEENPRDEALWLDYVPQAFRPNFGWPNAVERAEWIEYSKDKPVVISDTRHQLGSKWDFYSVVDAFHNGDYDLLRCEKVGEFHEIHIYPFGYPYGGLGPLVALAEGFGFRVDGVNEYGKYLPRQELRSDG